MIKRQNSFKFLFEIIIENVRHFSVNFLFCFAIFVLYDSYLKTQAKKSDKNTFRGLFDQEMLFIVEEVRI
jgi:hypothetical protein